LPTWYEMGVPAEVIESRSERDRDVGLTMVIDSGLGLAATREVLAVAGRWIDHWKLSFGTSALMPEETLMEKLALIRSAGLVVFPGGTLFESAVLNGHGEGYFEKAVRLGFTAVEISEGTLDLPASRRLSSIQAATGAGLIVISEVGKKDPLGQPTPRQLAEQALVDLDGGARWVVVEGRESGRSVGVFSNTGGVNMEAVETIALHVGDALDRLVWEAPIKRQQVTFIQRFGPNVSLGNIDPTRVLALEALRAGLRFETLQPLVRQQEANPDEWREKTGLLWEASFPTP